MKVTYISKTFTEDGQRVVRTVYPTLFPLHASVETPITKERSYAHWVAVRTLPFLPQAGDIFAYSLACDEDDGDEHCFLVVDWSYEDGLEGTLIRLDAEPVSQASYYKRAWLAELFSARTEVEEVPF